MAAAKKDESQVEAPSEVVVDAPVEAPAVDESQVEAPKKKAKSLVVTAPLIAAKIGNQVLHFRAGDVLPEGTDKASIDNLKSLGFVAEV